LDKIDARLKRVLDQPSGYADETKAQRDTQEELLRQFASCAKTEIGSWRWKCKVWDLTKMIRPLQENLGAFSETMKTDSRRTVSYDYIDLGLQTAATKGKGCRVPQIAAGAFAAKRAIHNLKQNPK